MYSWKTANWLTFWSNSTKDLTISAVKFYDSVKATHCQKRRARRTSRSLGASTIQIQYDSSSLRRDSCVAPVNSTVPIFFLPTTALFLPFFSFFNRQPGNSGRSIAAQFQLNYAVSSIGSHGRYGEKFHVGIGRMDECGTGLTTYSPIPMLRHLTSDRSGRECAELPSASAPSLTIIPLRFYVSSTFLPFLHG